MSISLRVSYLVEQYRSSDLPQRIIAVRSWPVMVTLVCWVAILVGLLRMFAPEVQQASQSAPTTFISASLVGAIGLFLTFKAGSRQYGE
jgi:hypothetical protein